jgi:hypothetical protein
MDTQTVLNGLFGIVIALLSWFFRELWAAIKELKDDLAKLNNDLPKEYVSKIDFRDDLHDIKNMIQKIFDKLDSKVDRDYR